MRKTVGLHLILLAALLFLVSLTSSAQNASKRERLDSLMTEEYNQKFFSGNILIIENGKELYCKSFGYADEEKKIPIDRNTKFEINSLSRQFTAYAILSLREKGKLQLDDLLVKHIPELSFYKGITLSQLLYQTVNWFDYELFYKKYGDVRKIANNEDIIRLAAEKEILWMNEPGNYFHDMNTNYMMLASVIERITKRPFEEFVATEIFQPLGMHHSMIYRTPVEELQLEGLAKSYIEDQEGNRKTPWTYAKDRSVSCIVGAEKMISTIDDLRIWDAFLKSDKFPYKELMYTSGKTNSGMPTNHGMGFKLDEFPYCGKVARQGGIWGGFASIFEQHLDHGTTIISLQNVYFPGASRYIDNARNILYDLKVQPYD